MIYCEKQVFFLHLPGHKVPPLAKKPFATATCWGKKIRFLNGVSLGLSVTLHAQMWLAYRKQTLHIFCFVLFFPVSVLFESEGGRT